MASQGYYQTAKNEHMVKYRDYPCIHCSGAAAVDFLKQAQNQDKPFCLSVLQAPLSGIPDAKFDDVYVINIAQSQKFCLRC